MKFFSGTPILWVQPDSPAGLGDVLKDHRALVDKSAGGDGPLLLVIHRRRRNARMRCRCSYQFAVGVPAEDLRAPGNWCCRSQSVQQIHNQPDRERTIDTTPLDG